MGTIDLTPGRENIRMRAGDDLPLTMFHCLDAPDGAVAAGTWDAGATYAMNLMVLHTTTVYVSVVPSVGVTPGTDSTKWRALTPMNLTGYTAWEMKVTSGGVTHSASVDATDQAAGVIRYKIEDTVTATWLPDVIRRWAARVVDAAGNTGTYAAGNVFVES